MPTNPKGMKGGREGRWRGGARRRFFGGRLIFAPTIRIRPIGFFPSLGARSVRLPRQVASCLRVEPASPARHAHAASVFLFPSSPRAPRRLLFPFPFLSSSDFLRSRPACHVAARPCLGCRSPSRVFSAAAHTASSSSAASPPRGHPPQTAGPVVLALNRTNELPIRPQISININSSSWEQQSPEAPSRPDPAEPPRWRRPAQRRVVAWLLLRFRPASAPRLLRPALLLLRLRPRPPPQTAAPQPPLLGATADGVGPRLPLASSGRPSSSSGSGLLRSSAPRRDGVGPPLASSGRPLLLRLRAPAGPAATRRRGGAPAGGAPSAWRLPPSPSALRL